MIFPLTEMGDAARCAPSTIGWSMNRATFRSRLGVLGLSVRGFAAMTEVQYRNRPALGQDGKRPSPDLPTLGAADAGNDGPDSISEAAGRGRAQAIPEIGYARRRG